MTSDSFRSGGWGGPSAVASCRLCVCVCPQGRLDLRKAAIMGHSFGGATAIQALSQDHRFLSAMPFPSDLLSIWISPFKVWDCSRLLDGAGPQRSPGDWCSTTSPLHQQLHLPVARQREEDDETDSSSAAHRSLCLHHPNTPVSSLES